MSKTHVPLSIIRDNEHQPRLGVGDLDSLADSILEHGLRQLPEARLLVDGDQPSYSPYTTLHEGEYFVKEDSAAIVELASGHRRTEAIRLLNEDDTVTDAALRAVGLVPGYVPVDLQRLSDEELLDLLTIENAQREDLSPVEEARLIESWMEVGRDAVEIAEYFGKSPSWVSNRKRLTTLPMYVQEHVHEAQISVRQAMALAFAESVWREAQEVFEHPTKINSDLKPGTMVSLAVDDAITSDDIRDRARELADFVERVEVTQKESQTDHSENSSPETDDPDRDREESSSSNVEAEPGARASSDFSAGTGGQEPDGDASREDAGGAEARPDEGERQEQEGAMASVGGDGAPSEDETAYTYLLKIGSRLAFGHTTRIQDRINTYKVHAGDDTEVLDTTEFASKADALDAERKLVFATQWLGLCTNGGKETMENIEFAREVYRRIVGVRQIDGPVSSTKALQNNVVGHVDRDDVDALLSAGEEMWDQDTAEGASVASLYVAWRVADRRREHWRCDLLVKQVREKMGSVTEDDFPDDVWQAAQAEIERRTNAEVA